MSVRAAPALAALLAACGLVGPAERAERAELEGARERWERVGPASYRVVERRECFCGEEGIGPVVITVAPEGVVRVYQSDGRPVPPPMQRFFPTVEELFAEVEAALDRGDHRVEATYDPGTGAPVQVYLDRDERLADEEVRWILGAPEPLPANGE